jgi:pimeloyl-ACP methyl ester carboxylesterase
VDNDRVFLFGFGDGANFAMDVGASHPDLFAGVVAMGPNPKYYGMFMHYWRNTQKLPVYAVTGTINGGSLQSLRQIFENWMPKGFPAIMSVYRGRGMEWYSAELPPLFDWMGRKKRVTGTASLRLGQRVEPWYMMRAEDNRFYWVGTDEIAANCLRNANPGKNVLPAEMTADIRQGNLIELRSRGIRNITIWLDRDMIDWSKPVRIRHGDSMPPKGYKPAIMKPDLDVMLEELYRRGDRSMLFMQKIVLEVNP